MGTLAAALGTPRWRGPRTWLRLALIGGLFALAAVVLTWPMALNLDSSLVAAEDPRLNAWILAWDVHALSTDPLDLYQANIYYPFPLPLTYSETLLGGALLVAPLLWLTGNPALGHNVLTLASLSIAGFAMYLLVRELTRHDLAGVLAGLLFGFTSYQQDQLIHVQLLQTGWLVVALLAAHRALREATPRHFLLLGVAIVGEAWTSIYLFALQAIALGTFLAFEGLTGRRMWCRSRLLGLVVTALAVGALIVPAARPYIQTQQTFQFTWPIELVRDLSAVPTDYLTVSTQKLLYPALLDQFRRPVFPGEHGLFPGFAMLALAGLAVGALGSRWANGGRRRETLRYLVLLLVAFVFSLGPSWTATGTGADGMPTPFLVLYRSVPGIAALRVPARFEFLVLLSLSVLAGFGVSWLDGALRARLADPARRAALAGVGVLVVLDILPLPKQLVPIGPGAPPVYMWLHDHDPQAVVAEIPDTPLANFTYEFYSAYHWHPLVNGISGFNPPQVGPIVAQLAAFPDGAAVENLRSLGVRYVVAHRDGLAAETVAALDRLQRAPTPTPVHVAAVFGSDVVYVLDPRPGLGSSLVQDYLHIDLPAEVDRAVPSAVAVSVENDTLAPLAIRSVGDVDVEVATDGGDAWSERRLFPRFMAPGDAIIDVLPLAPAAQSASPDQVQVHVRVHGLADLDLTRVVRLVDLPTSAQSAGLAASVSYVGVPSAVDAGAKFDLEVVARNVGRAAWLADTGQSHGAVGAAIHAWTRPDGTPVRLDSGNPLMSTAGHLDWNVNPGQTAAFTIHAQAPAIAGQYQVVVDLLSESVTWFEDVHGGARTVVPLHVVGEV